MDENLSVFIKRVNHEPYSLVTNNCIVKTLRIRAEAFRLGKQADLVFCLLFFRIKCLADLPVVSPHIYLIIEGKKVDVPLSPSQERKICKNIEVKPFLKVNLSKVKRLIYDLWEWPDETGEQPWKLMTSA